MIVKNKGIETITNQSTVTFELDNSSGHLFSVLSELYSRPEESTIRELATNCSDAHIMSNNQDRPFIIKLPNKEKNIFNISFRDFGPGLNHEQVMQIYRIYGKSTKTDSDTQTGCLGLGSKSPFSISSTFYVKSYKDGICSQYTCSMDNQGKPNITEEPILFDTYEENGLEVVVPIYKEMNFQNIILRALKYFKVKPLVYTQNGSLEKDTLIDMNWKQLTEVKHLTDTIAIPSEHFNINKFLESLNKANQRVIENEVIQLQVYYPLDSKLILDTINRFNLVYSDEQNVLKPKFKISNDIIKTITYLLNTGIQFYSKPGCIAFAPSRETIKYNELTLIYIIKELIKAAKRINKMALNKLSKIQTYEDTFDTIYLGDTQITNLLKRFGDIELNSEVIKDSKLLFDKELDQGDYVLFSSTKSFESGMSNSKSGIYHTFPGTLNKLKPYFIDNLVRYKNLRWANIWDHSTLWYNIDQVLVYNFRTPFIKEFEQQFYFKMVCEVIKNLIFEIASLLKFTFEELNDLELMNLKDSFAGFNPYKNLTAIDPLKIKETKRVFSDSVIREISSYKIGHLLNLINSSDYNRGKNINKQYKKFNSKLKHFYKLLSLSSSNHNLILEQLNISELNLLKFDEELLTIKPKPVKLEKIEILNAKFFNKMAKAQNKFKRKFDDLLREAFNFSELVPNFYNFIESSEITNEIYPLDNIISKDKYSDGIYSWFSQLVILFLYKEYPKEVLKQFQHNTDVDFQRKYIMDQFESWNIPKKYILGLEPAKRYKKLRAQNSPMNLLEDKILRTDIIYYENIDVEKSIDVFKNIVLDQFSFYKEILQILLKTYKKETYEQVLIKVTEQSNNIVLSKYDSHLMYSNLVKYKERFKNLFYSWTAKDLEYDKDGNLLDAEIRYNNHIKYIFTFENFLQRIIFDQSRAISDEIIKFLKENNYYGKIESISIDSNSDFQSNIKFEENILPCINIDNVYHIYLPLNRIDKSTKQKIEIPDVFIWSNSLTINIPAKKNDEYLERFFSENNVCNFSEFKINYGRNYTFKEKELNNPDLKLETLQAKCKDSGTRVKRNAFFDTAANRTFTTSSIKIMEPDIYMIYLDGSKLHTKYKKLLINPIQLTLGLANSKIITTASKRLGYGFSSGFNDILLPNFVSRYDSTKHIRKIMFNSIEADFTETLEWFSKHEFGLIFNLVRSKDLYSLYYNNFSLIEQETKNFSKEYSKILKERLEETDLYRRLIFTLKKPNILNYFPNYLNNGIGLNELLQFAEEDTKSFIHLSEYMRFSDYEYLNDIQNYIKQLNIFTNFYIDLISVMYNNTREALNDIQEETNTIQDLKKRKIDIGLKVKQSMNGKDMLGSTESLIRKIEDILESIFKYKEYEPSKIEKLINSYYKPNFIKEKKIKFNKIEDLIVGLELKKRKTILHQKINRRTKKSQLKENISR